MMETFTTNHLEECAFKLSNHPELSESEFTEMIPTFSGMKSLDLSRKHAISSRFYRQQQDIDKLNYSKIWMISDPLLIKISAISHIITDINLSNIYRITDRGVTEIARACSNLAIVNLTSCFRLTDESLVAIAESCPDLAQLIIDDCALMSGDGVQEIARNCGHLQLLHMNNCVRMTDQAVISLKKGIRSLEMSGCPLITNRSLLQIKCMLLRNIRITLLLPNLTIPGLQCFFTNNPHLVTVTIEMRHTVIDISFGRLGLCCPRLSTVSLTHASMPTGANWLIPVVRDCANLTALDLTGAGDVIDDRLIVNLARNCATLVDVTLDGCDVISDFGVRALAFFCRGMRRVSVRGCAGVGDAGIMAIAGMCAEIRELAMSGCVLVTNRSLVKIADSCRMIEAIDVCGCVRVGSAGVRSLAESKYRDLLKRFSCRGCKWISKQAFTQLVSECRGLEHLNAGLCDGFDDQVVSLLVIHCRRINFLSLVGVKHITDAALESLRFCKHLAVVDVSENPFITNRGIRNLILNCKSTLYRIFFYYCPQVSREIEEEFENWPIQLSLRHRTF